MPDNFEVPISEEELEEAKDILTRSMEGEPPLPPDLSQTELREPKKKTGGHSRVKEAMIKRLEQKVMETGDHNAFFRIAQVRGWIVEKREETIKVELSADEIARRNFEADRRLRLVPNRGEGEGTGHRLENVPEKPALLSGEVCVDNQSEHKENSKVGDVAIPE